MLHFLTYQEQIPFAVVGSDRYVSVGSKNVLGRKTKWGIIEGKVFSCNFDVQIELQGKHIAPFRLQMFIQALTQRFREFISTQIYSFKIDLKYVLFQWKTGLIASFLCYVIFLSSECCYFFLHGPIICSISIAEKLRLAFFCACLQYCESVFNVSTAHTKDECLRKCVFRIKNS